MTMPFYASAEQVMRDRSEYARKGIARGRGVVVLSCADGVVFVAENPSTSLHKVSEIYDRIGFAGVGKYPEYETLRVAGIRYTDNRGFTYDRRDVTGRALANTYAQSLGVIFMEQQKPFEVELCVAEVGKTPDEDEIYRITYDGSVNDEPDFVTMGGQAEGINTALRQRYRQDMTLGEAVAAAVQALASVGSDNGQARQLTADQLEVAVLDRQRPNRAFRRITGAALTALLPAGGDGPHATGESAGSADGDQTGQTDNSGPDNGTNSSS